MIKIFSKKLLLILVFSVFLFSGDFIWAQTNPLSIDTGSPLRVRVFEEGWVQVLHYNNVDNAWEPQIYVNWDSYAGAASKLFLNGTNQTDAYETGYLTGWGSGNEFTYTSHSQPDIWTIASVWTAGVTGVTVTQTVTYINGTNRIKFVWSVTNGGVSTYNDVRFMHVQDTYLDNQDNGYGHWNPSLGMVYISNPDPTIAGIMGMYGGAGSAASRYDSIGYWSTEDSADGGQLSNTVIDGYSHDAAYALQWNRTSLAPGETWTVTMYEKFTEPGEVLVSAPASTTGNAGQLVTMVFTVENLQTVSDTFDLSVAATPNGWTTALPDGNTVILDDGESSSVNVTVQIPAGASLGDSENISLTAVSQYDVDVSNSDNCDITVSDSATTKNLNISVSGGGTTNPAPGIYNYPNDSVVEVTAIPDPGETFLGWSGDIPSGSEMDNPVSITLDSDKSITASFSGEPEVERETRYRVNVSVVGEGGSVERNLYKVKEGNDVKIKIFPEEGYELIMIIDNGYEVPVANPYWVYDVMEYHDVQVYFTKIKNAPVLTLSGVRRSESSWTMTRDYVDLNISIVEDERPIEVSDFTLYRNTNGSWVEVENYHNSGHFNYRDKYFEPGIIISYKLTAYSSDGSVVTESKILKL